MTFLQLFAIYCICGTTYGTAMVLVHEDVRVEIFGKGFKRTFEEWFFSFVVWAAVSYLMWWYLLPLDVADWIKSKSKKE